MMSRQMPTKSHDKVLVLGSDTRMVLPIARSLGRRGIEVHVAWCKASDPALRSRYVTAVHAPPAYSPQDRAWIGGLIALVQQEQFALVIPATEAAVFACQMNREALERNVPLYLLSQTAFETVFSKQKTAALAASLGVRVPRSVVLSAEPSPEQLAESFPLPAIVKPCSSICVGENVSKNFVRRIDNRDELRDCLQQLARDGTEALVQENFSGDGIGVEVLADAGKILFAFQHTRLHETMGYGSTYRKSVALDPELFEATSRLLAGLRYTGVAMVEFRQNRESGEWVLLEINGRFWGSLPLAIAAGADFPFYLYELLVHNRRQFPQGYRVGVHCHNLTDDARWFWRTLRRKRPNGAAQNDESFGWAVNRIPRWQLIKEIGRIVTFRDRLDTLALDDPLPGLAELAGLFGWLFRRQSSAT